MTITIVVLVALIVLMVWDKFPLALVAVSAPVALNLLGVLKPAETFAGFTNSNVIRTIGMMVIGGAFFQTGNAHSVSQTLVKYAKNERAVLAVIMMVSGLLSAVLSNTGVTTTMIPIVAGICASLHIRRSKLMMPITIAVGCGGTISLVGAIPNATANTVLEGYGYEGFSFFEMGMIGFPLLILTTLFLCTVGYRLLPDREDPPDEIYSGHTFDHIPVWKKRASVIIMVLAFLTMAFDKQIGIPMHVSSIVGALILTFLNVISEKNAIKAIDMRTVFILGGMLPIATALEKTGAGDKISVIVVNTFGNLASPFLLMLVLYIIANIMTQFMSNTATSAVLCPIGISIASGLGADPKAVMAAIVFGVSFAYSTPLGMPPNAMVMGPGGYKFNDYVKVGIPLLILAFIFCMIFLPIFWPMAITPK